MKKYIIIVSIGVLLYLAFDFVYFYMGLSVPFGIGEVTAITKVDDKKIYKKDSGTGEYKEFEIKGVDMGSGMPGEWSTDYKIDEDTYYRWFGEIQEMGANCVRVYTIQADKFYNAFSNYNNDRVRQGEEPLYLIQGLWVNDYIQNSDRDAYDEEFVQKFMDDGRTMINVIHGQQKLNIGTMASAGSGSYMRDVSQWVVGYIWGVEWEDMTVAFTDENYEDNEHYSSYKGEYLYTKRNATPFEAMLARVGDYLIRYETNRYRTQRVFAFLNWPTTDPFDYSDGVTEFFQKCAKVDVEHIKATDKVVSGQFASYHVYPYYPDYLTYEEDWERHKIDKEDYSLGDGKYNTYLAYLTMLTNHHDMPVVISEFGASTGRGMAQDDYNTHRNQGNMSEKEQGVAIISCYEDIKEAGCAGACIFSWQDEWFERTWNTMYAVNLKRNPYWSDYQTNQQYFGMLSFDPGNDKSICYVDGDVSEWTDNDVVSENNGMKLSIKYDEKFMYFLIYKKGFNLSKNKLYIPIDITPKSGSTYSRFQDVLFERPVDFLIEINGKDESRVWVQERYESLRSTYPQNIEDYKIYLDKYIPDKDSSLFKSIDMVLETQHFKFDELNSNAPVMATTFETGKLKYGNANPDSEDFNSLADFICSSDGDYVELKIPWQLLNFADPSTMQIHDDYYDGNYGVELMNINEMYVGVGSDDTGEDEKSGTTSERIKLDRLALNGWGNHPTYHERLKSSYYIMKEYWTKEDNTENKAS